VGTYKKKNGKPSRKVAYIVFELAERGQLFDYILQSGEFSEPVARYYFKQLLEGLEYTHNSGISHRDLKLENLLVDSNYNLKIADFGLSAPINGRDGKGFLTTNTGTDGYMAPEIHLKLSYEGRVVDLFASAVILFTLVQRNPPFNMAT